MPGAGSGGTLGEEVEPGKYEGSNIPSAKDDGEVYDTRFFPRSSFDCSPFGTITIRGPRGIVTKFVPDATTAKTVEKHGPATVQTDGTTTCIVIPRWQETTTEGVRTYFHWFDACCLLDCVTLLEFVKEEREPVGPPDVTILEPLIYCVTDWPKWLRDKLIELIKSGVSLDRAKMLLGVVRAESDALELREGNHGSALAAMTPHHGDFVAASRVVAKARGGAGGGGGHGHDPTG